MADCANLVNGVVRVLPRVYRNLMNLFHGTSRIAWEKIKVEGLKPSRIGIVYLSPDRRAADDFGGNEVLLEVETGDTKLTAFDDCKEWEVLCWGHISADKIRLMKIKDFKEMSDYEFLVWLDPAEVQPYQEILENDSDE